jgi:excisionase family DNA binding protein
VCAQIHEEGRVIEELLTVRDVAGFLKVSQNTVRALTERGELECYRVGGRGERRFSKAQVAAYLEKHTQKLHEEPEETDAGASWIREPGGDLSSTPVLNRGLHVHDWYLMPESYSEPLILRAMGAYGIRPNATVLDPFAGAGTTLVTACLQGVNAVGFEVNPFLCFASRVKLDLSVNPHDFETAARSILNEAEPLLAAITPKQGLFSKPAPPNSGNEAQAIVSSETMPGMPRLEEWMAPLVVRKVLILRHIIHKHAPQRLRGHFLLALAAVLRPASNMKLTPHAFGSRSEKVDSPVLDLFAHRVAKVRTDLEYVGSMGQHLGRAEVFQCDAKSSGNVRSGLLPASLAITSPPYLNNLDYTMQTRMELFFLGFVNDMQQLREIRKAMVACDAKAVYKDVKDSPEVRDVNSVQRIAEDLREAHKDKNWGWDYAYMTTQYFGGMAKALRATKRLLKRGARFVLVVGESAHSGVKIPVPDILAELGERCGYRFEDRNVLRHRRSSSHKHQLVECELVLRRK